MSRAFVVTRVSEGSGVNAELDDAARTKQAGLAFVRKRRFRLAAFGEFRIVLKGSGGFCGSAFTRQHQNDFGWSKSESEGPTPEGCWQLPSLSFVLPRLPPFRRILLDMRGQAQRESRQAQQKRASPRPPGAHRGERHPM